MDRFYWIAAFSVAAVIGSAGNPLLAALVFGVPFLAGALRTMADDRQWLGLGAVYLAVGVICAFAASTWFGLS